MFASTCFKEEDYQEAQLGLLSIDREMQRQRLVFESPKRKPCHWSPGQVLVYELEMHMGQGVTYGGSGVEVWWPARYHDLTLCIIPLRLQRQKGWRLAGCSRNLSTVCRRGALPRAPCPDSQTRDLMFAESRDRERCAAGIGVWRRSSVAALALELPWFGNKREGCASAVDRPSTAWC